MQPIAFLFPGQGSQYVGMGQDFYREYDLVRELFDMAGEITKVNLTRLCFKGPIEELTQTVNLQPAVTVVNLACLAAISKEGLSAHVSAGHSLGEFTALHSAGVLTAEDTLRLVYHRGVLMHRESLKHKGTMSAIVGLGIDTLEPLVKEAQRQGRVSIANHNTSQQIVITGEPSAVDTAAEMAVREGAKAISLKVSGAWHSELIRGAEAEFQQILSSVTVHEPKSMIVFNVTADTAAEPEQIRAIMGRQLCSPVKWFDSVQRIINEGCSSMVEVGPGKVLAGIVRKIMPKGDSVPIYNVSDLPTLERFLKDHT